MADSKIEIEKKTASSLQCNSLEDEEVKASLSLFKNIVTSCYGPNGKIKMLQNANGGHVTLTSSSSRLLQMLPISKPFLKVLTTAVQGHINVYKDGGLLACCFASIMLEKSLCSDVHKKLLIDLYDHFFRKVIAYLESRECRCKMKIDVSRMTTLQCIVRSVLKTKPTSTLQGADVTAHMTNLIIESFLKSYSVQSEKSCWFSSVSYISLEGRSPVESFIINGVLFEFNTTLCAKDGFSVKQCYSSAMKRNQIKVALLVVSMSGDSSDYLDVSYESDKPLDVTAVSLDTMRRLCDQFYADEVGVVLCQKVIHPNIKKYLSRKGVIAVERLGSSYIKVVEELTGAVPINSLHTSVNQYGWLDTLTEYTLEQKKYLHMQREGASVCSMVLYNRMEESLQETKTLCEVALHSLRLCLQVPYVLPGAGCWQTHVASFIRSKIKSASLDVFDELGCSKLQYQRAGENFAHSLELTAKALDKTCDHLTDSTNHHHWMIPEKTKYGTMDMPTCGCGMIQNTGGIKKFCYMGEHNSDDLINSTFSKHNDAEDTLCTLDDMSVVDSFAVMLNALKVSVSSCNMLLGISHTITDNN